MRRISYDTMLEVRCTQCPAQIAQVREMSVGELLRTEFIKMPCDHELEFDHEGFGRAVQNVNTQASVVHNEGVIGFPDGGFLNANDFVLTRPSRLK